MNRPALRLQRYSLVLILLALSVALSACGRSSNQDSSGNTGSLATQITWPVQGTLASPSPNLKLQSALSGGGIRPMAAPIGVENIKVTVTGSSFTIVKEFDSTPGSEGSGTISGIPAPSTVSVTVEGLDGPGGTTLYLGQKLGVLITVGGSTSETIAMTLVNSTPPPVPVVTSPSANPFYTQTAPTTLSGLCSDSTHTVTLSGENSQGPIPCVAGGTYSFTVPTPAGPEGLFTYFVVQTSVTGLVSPAACHPFSLVSRLFLELGIEGFSPPPREPSHPPTVRRTG